MRRSLFARSLLALAPGLLIFTAASPAANKKDAAARQPHDGIEVIGHIALPHGPVTRFVATRHYRSYYLYAEHAGGRDLTLLDVTTASRPAVLFEVADPTGGGSGSSVFAAAGTTALVAEGTAEAATQPPPETLRIMDFSDPEHPRVSRELTGVTAISRDERRDLIFVANRDGIWILHQNFALDPEVEKEYSRQVLYGH